MKIENRRLTGNNTQIMDEEKIKNTINFPKQFMEYYDENLLTYHVSTSTTIPIIKLKNQYQVI